MNHTFYSATAHTSDRDLTTHNPASLDNLNTPFSLPPSLTPLNAKRPHDCQTAADK